MWTWQWLQDFWDWLGQRFDGIERALNALNPEYFVVFALEKLGATLPYSEHAIKYALDDMRAFLVYFYNYIGMLDYFIHLPNFFVVLYIIMSGEAMLLLLRGWRVVRSLVT